MLCLMTRCHPPKTFSCYHKNGSPSFTDQTLHDQSFLWNFPVKSECTTFEQKLQVIDMLDVRGTLAIENDEKVVYVKCILGQQLLSVARTSPLSNIGAIETMFCTSHPMAQSQ